jgi:hypothetical protein
MTRGHYGASHSRSPGNYGRGGTHVGISLFHTVGDRDRAVEQMNTELVMTVSDLIGRMGVDPKVFVQDIAAMTRDPVGYVKRIQAARATMEKSPLYPIYRDTLSPFYDEWNKFYTDQSSWQEWLTNWDEYEHWADRVKAIRASVDSQLGQLDHGPLASPTPGDLSTTLPGAIIDTTGRVIKKVGTAAEKGAGDIWSMVKIGVYGALGIAGILAVTSIVQQVRKGQDPAEKYLAMARATYKDTRR